jgi:FAS-associated factor 2
MTLLARIEGPATTAQLTGALTTAVTRTLPVLNRRRALLREQHQARELRRMQEEAYTNSLAADRAREQAQRQAQAEQSHQAALEAQRTQAQELAARNKEQWRLWKAADLRKRGIIDMKSEIGKTARVGIRLSGGERIVQIFPGEWGVGEVYAFVECYDLLFPSPTSGITLRSAADTTVVGDFEKPEWYEHEFGFRLMIPVAKKTVEIGGVMIKESELWPSGNIIVVQLEESDSEESEDDEGDE